MDSGDEAGSGSEAEADGPGRAEAPPAARDVQTLGQMIRLAESLRGRERLAPAELLDVVGAAGRVRFYDPALFGETLAPALLQCLRKGLDDGGGERFSVDSAVELVRILAELNAAGALAEVFAAAASALAAQGGALSKDQRRLLKEVYRAAGREADVAFLARLRSDASLTDTEVRGSTREGLTGDGFPMRPGQRICESYMRTGQCRAGTACRWDHPEGFRVTYNPEGYPQRPWAPVCPYYMAMGSCDYRKTCKWHHPDKRDRECRTGGTGMTHAWIPKGGMG